MENYSFPKDMPYDFRCKDDIDVGYMCWDQGKNPDLPYLQTVMKAIHEHSAIDFHNMVSMGYSAGAQMVSASLSLFPNLTFTDSFNNAVRFPYPKAAFMIAGGSQYCYAYNPKDGDYLHAPPPYQPCQAPPKGCGGSGGAGAGAKKKCVWNCCPVNSTERAYMDGTLSYNNHPPVILLQTEMDHFASPLASRRYYDVAVTEDFPATRIVGSGYYHGLIQEQEVLFARLVHHYLTRKTEQLDSDQL